MKPPNAKTDLGFAQAQITPGAHICQIYVDEHERDDALTKFIMAGLLAKECTACFSDQLDRERLVQALADVGLDCDEEIGGERLQLSGAEAVYFEGNCFNPDRMLGLIAQYYDSAIARDFSAARVIGEMSARIDNIPGGSRLFEYESRVNDVLRERPVAAVCQYDARAFDGRTIMDVLSVHPMTLFRGAVVHNPYFVSPASLRRP